MLFNKVKKCFDANKKQMVKVTELFLSLKYNE